VRVAPAAESTITTNVEFSQHGVIAQCRSRLTGNSFLEGFPPVLVFSDLCRHGFQTAMPQVGRQRPRMAVSLQVNKEVKKAGLASPER
jgi:hypothetical protein